MRGLHGKVSNMSVMRIAVLLFSPDLCEVSIEGFIEDQTSSPSYDLAPRTPSFFSSEIDRRHTERLRTRREKLLMGGGGEGGRGVESYDRKNARADSFSGF